jgi:2'-5' RNA ligase
LGKAKDLDGEKLKKVVAGFAESCPPLEGELSGAGKFTGGKDPVTYATADLPGLPSERERLIAALEGAGLPVSKEHGFTPHMTLAYEDRDVDVKAKPLRFKAVSVKLGDERTDFPLAGAAV